MVKPETEQLTRWSKVDYSAVADYYALPLPPLPGHSHHDPVSGERWCAIPWCRNHATPRREMCRPHRLLQLRASWSAADLIAREMVKEGRPGAGCANPACPQSETPRPSRVPTSERVRQYAVRRFWGQFPIGGEFLCRPCSDLVNEIANAFEAHLSPVEVAVERVSRHARAAIPHATYEKLTGQAILRSRRLPPSQLDVADGYTLDQFVHGLAQYTDFWANIADGAYRLRTDPAEALDWMTSLIEGAAAETEGLIAGDVVPPWTIPYTPHPAVIDAMLGRFPRNLRG